MTTVTLYEQLGGYDAIAAVADMLMDRIKDDNKLRRFYKWIVLIKVLFLKLIVYWKCWGLWYVVEYSRVVGNAAESSAAAGQSPVRWEANFAG